MRKSHLLFSIVVLSVALYAPVALRAQCAAASTTYTSDANIADFTTGLTYATFSNFSSGDTGTLPPPFTPTSAELAASGLRIYGGGSLTGLPATNNWILATFPIATPDILVFPNIDHFGSAYDGYQYTIQGSNDLSTWTPLFDALTVTASDTINGEPFTLCTLSGTEPSTVNNVLTPGSGPGGKVGYIAHFHFGTAYKYYAFGASTEAVGAGNADQELSAVATAFITPQQGVSGGGSNTFTDPGTSGTTNQYTFPTGTTFGCTDDSTAKMAVSFQYWVPTVFDTTRLPGVAQPLDWSGGTTPLPAGTTCTVINGTGGDCLVLEALCYCGTTKLPQCDTASTTGLISIVNTYTPATPQLNPLLAIADDGQNDWANITTSFTTDTTIGGGTKKLNTDLFIGDQPAGICLLYDDTKAVKSGAAYPIKLYLCNPFQADVSGSGIVLHATQVVLISTSATSDVLEAGASNSDFDFRFDSTLGPSGGYIFNLKTTGLSKGQYELVFTVNGVSDLTYVAPFNVK